VKSKTEKLLDELVKLHPKYIDLSLERLNIRMGINVMLISHLICLGLMKE